MKELSSFRDNSGFIFKNNNVVFRQVNYVYKAHYDHLMQSGLYQELTSKFLLVTHQEQPLHHFETNKDAYKILEPFPIDFISYPYSWSFSMLKDAALLTLQIQTIALKYKMVLKDANAFNIQFVGSQPILIDTLSFEVFKEGVPWIGYRQFCQHFLAPLALMVYTDISLSKLSIIHLDGIPLALAAKLLPFNCRFKLGIAVHLLLHAKMTQKHSAKKVALTNNKFTNNYFEALTVNLSDTISSLKWAPTGTEWGEYYDKAVSKAYFIEKEKIIRKYYLQLNANKVLDLGSNDGTFSKIAKEYSSNVFSFDIDPACVEKNYLMLKADKNRAILPLMLDITNPEPGIGWMNQERSAILKRINVDTVMALAIIHHLAISNNLPLDLLSHFFYSLSGKNLIIEFVPKTDEKVQILLRNREDIFPDYTLENFIKTFSNHFKVIAQTPVLPTERVLFLLEKL